MGPSLITLPAAGFRIGDGVPVATVSLLLFSTWPLCCCCIDRGWFVQISVLLQEELLYM